MLYLSYQLKKEGLLMTIKVFEAFSGIGATRSALKRLQEVCMIDFEFVGISEIDKFAIKSYQAIHGETPCYGDINSSEILTIEDIDFFSYTFPCTDLSLAGKQKGLYDGKHSSLLWSCKTIIDHFDCEYLFMENVPTLLNKNHIEGFDEWCRYLNSKGYTNYIKVINSKDCGIAQDRKRLYMISTKHKVFQFPIDRPTIYSMNDYLEKQVDKKYYLPTIYQYQANHSLKQLDLSYHTLDSSLRYGGLFDTSTSKKQAGGIYDPYSLCPTLTTMQGGYRQPIILQNGSFRRLTPLECFRLFGFRDDDFYKAQQVCSDTQLYKQAGNSITIPVLVKLFENLFVKENPQ